MLMLLSAAGAVLTTYDWGYVCPAFNRSRIHMIITVKLPSSNFLTVGGTR
ncbi:hypothetical protein J7E26_03140 [Bacillus sp. ISL-51]|nr:hypothetical protein [Bacillus sp. ISL-51]